MDLVLYNGNIITLDDKMPYVKAVGVRGSKILGIGDDHDLLKEKDHTTQLINLEGKTVLPGFNDSHLHLISYGLSKRILDLQDCLSINHLIKRTKDFIASKRIPFGEWVQGRGWNHDSFQEKRLPTRTDLDKISTRHFILVKRSCGQMSVLNSNALGYVLRMLDREDRDFSKEADGFIQNEKGEYTGVVLGTSQDLIYRAMPLVSVDDLKEYIEAALSDYVQAGITSVQTDDFEFKKSKYRDILKAYEELEKDLRLPVRVNKMVCLPDKRDLHEFVAGGYKTGVGSNFFKIGPYKLQSDGSLGTNTAALHQPYLGDEKNVGILYYHKEEFEYLMEKAYRQGFQLVADGIGDRGIELVLDTFKKLSIEYPRADPRFCVDHCQITNESILEKFKKNNVIAGLEIIFLSSDLQIVEEKIGKERAKLSYNWRDFLDRRVPIALGSDSPVEPYNPMYTLYTAVSRKNLQGYPKDGWYPSQSLSLAEAVKGYTVGSAYSTFEENVKGTITPGKFADMVVLSHDIFQIDEEELKDVRTEKTIVDGKIVFRRGI